MQMQERLVLALEALTDVIERLEAAAVQTKAMEAARLADLLAANEEVGARLAETASALRVFNTSAASRPDGPE